MPSFSRRYGCGLVVMMLLICGAGGDAFANGAVARVEQQKRLVEQQILQQRLIQQQQVERALQERAIQEKAAQVQLQQRVLQQKALQNAAQQKAVLEYREALQEAADQRAREQQAAFQVLQSRKIQNERMVGEYAVRQKALAQQAAEISRSYQGRQQALYEESARPPRRRSWQDPPLSTETVSMSQILEELKSSSSVWALMVDDGPKLEVIEEYIDWYRDQGVKIRKTPEHYVTLIDDIALENENLLNNAFKDVMMFVAIIEYDFDNGQDKDQLARRILGEQGYQANRQRLGL